MPKRHGIQFAVNPRIEVILMKTRIWIGRRLRSGANVQSRVARDVNPMKTLIFLCAALILAACATTAPPAARTIVTHPMTAASSANSATGTTPASAVAAVSPSAAFLRQARLAGYHIKNLREGTTVF